MLAGWLLRASWVAPEADGRYRIGITDPA